MTTNSISGQVCVIGAGLVGLLAAKNLIEQGLEVTILTKDSYIGGLWHYSDDPEKTTALPSTSANTSKHTNAFTDFPMPDEFPTHPPSRDLCQYLEAYASKFGLFRYMRYDVEVTSVDRDAQDKLWMVTAKDVKSGEESTLQFKKVVLATGILNSPHQVHFEHEAKFEGEIIHSRAFKDPSKYSGKNVMVVGIGASGADTLVFLKKAGAGRIYMSHRAQYWVLPRIAKGVAFDHSMTRRIGAMVRWIASCSTSLCASLMGKGLKAAQFAAFPWLKDHPSFASSRDAPHMLHRVPFFSDHLAEYLRDGHIDSVQGIQKVQGPRSVLLTDGTVIDDLDAIIVCSGYHYDMSMLKGKARVTDPENAPDRYERLKSAKHCGPHDVFPRLYRGFMSEQYPESLAVVGHVLIPKGPMCLNDLITMSLASLWSEDYPMPSKEDMKKDIDGHYNFIVKELSRGPIPHLGFRINARDTYLWLNDAAGTGVNERLGGWNLEAWKFWWHDRRFYKMLMDGPDVPAVYRLFDTGRGRMVWPGARRHIEKINAQIKQLGDGWKERQGSTNPEVVDSERQKSD